MFRKGLYAITDFNRLSTAQVLAKSELILRYGISLFQYRNKTQPATEIHESALQLRELCRKYNTPFIVNDDIELAKNIEADGVHLGQHDVTIEQARGLLGSVIIGVSCYNRMDLARLGQQQGADYIAFGAFYPSSVKPEAVTAKPSLLEQAKAELNVPVVAIGGITPKNGKVLIEAGADLLAVISALYGVEDITSALNEFDSFLE